MQKVVRFLLENWDGIRPLLLGYSGGPDSKALLHVVREAKIPFHIAHVDHGWREESFEEAELAKREAESLGVPFHSVRLAPASKTNREAAAREGRYQFFQTLFATGNYQALLLGHHADDAAETVIKRLFEGAHLAFLGGMQPVGILAGLIVWRPLLKVRRSEIVAWLKEKGISALDDPSNRDPAYLRSRMRSTLFPFLNECFGKEVVENLTHLSERTGELKEYLDRKTASCPRREGTWGFALNCRGLERIEARHLLQRAARGVPRTVLEPLLDWLEGNLDHRRIFFQSNWIVHHRGWIIFLKSSSGKALPEKGEVRKLVISFDATHSKPDF